MQDQHKRKRGIADELSEICERLVAVEALASAQERAEQRARHLNAALRVARSLGRLLTQENEREALLQAACDSLIETGAYPNAWIGLTNESGDFDTVAAAGAGEGFAGMLEQLTTGKLNVSDSDVTAIEEPLSSFADSASAHESEGLRALTVPVAHGGQTHGRLSVSIPSAFAANDEEQAVFKTLAQDLAFALYNIGLKAERMRAEGELRRLNAALEAQVEAHAVELAETTERLQAEIAGFKKVEEKLRRARDDLALKNKERMAELSKARKQFEAQLAARKQAEGQLRAARDELQSRVVKLTAQLDESLKASQAEVAELRESLDVLRRARDELLAEAEERAAELSQANDALAEQTAARREAEDALKAARGALESRVAELTAELKKVRETSQAEIAALKQSQDSLRHSNDESQARVGEQTAKLENADKLLQAEITRQRTTLDTLRALEERFRTIADFAYDWEYWVAPDGSIAYMSPSCERIAGYRVEEFCNDPGLLESIIHPADLERVAGLLHPRSAGREPLAVTFRIIRRAGDESWIAHTSQAVYATDGRYLGRRASNREINRLMQLEQEREAQAANLDRLVEERVAELQQLNDKLQQEIAERRRAAAETTIKEFAVESSPHAIAFLDVDDNITYANRSFLELWGYDTDDEVRGKPIYHFWQSGEQISQAMAELRDGETWAGKLAARKRDGAAVDLTVSAHLLPDAQGKPICLIMAFADSPVAGPDAFPLARAKRLAASARLAASIAREIASPVEAMSAMLDTLKQKQKANIHLLPGLDLGVLLQLEGALDGIRDTTRKLIALKDSGRTSKQPVSVNDVIGDTLMPVMGELDRRKVRVNLDLAPRLPRIPASPEQLARVLQNLINNAVEAISGTSTPGGRGGSETTTDGEISIKTGVANGNVTVSIADNGPGLPEGDVESVFDPFYTRKQDQGLGIGLAICHRIIEAHDGTIEAANSPEGGAVFTIVLPLEKAPADARAQ